VTRVAILGAAGFSGQETLDRVLAHPSLEVAALGSDSLAGSSAASLDPRLDGRWGAFVSNDEAARSGVDVLFCCLENERAAALEAPAGTIVVDLSGAHRLREPALYAEWYGFEHPRPDSLSAWTYGLPELWPPSGSRVANPGCYATAVLLALTPVRHLVDGHVVVDAKSGVSGAGKALRPSVHAAAVLENVVPYRVGRHQHVPEIEQALGLPICFVPHLLPVRRGLIATCYVRAREDVRDVLEEAYAASPAVTVLPQGVAPELQRVQGTDAAELGVFVDRATGTTIVVCALDNLGKGAAGQAIQNTNLLLGLDETLGLRLAGVRV
jgi:N-acetyl-gamma-glutamyl-phosphate reductase